MSEEKKVKLGLGMVSILKNPYIAFLLGFVVSWMVFTNPIILVGVLIVIGMALYAFRDRIEFRKEKEEKAEPKAPPGYRLVKEAPPQVIAPPQSYQAPPGYVLVPDPQATSFRSKLTPCPECGSLTKHKRTCSHYGETTKKA